jgi:hypothetical protein
VTKTVRRVLVVLAFGLAVGGTGPAHAEDLCLKYEGRQIACVPAGSEFCDVFSCD